MKNMKECSQGGLGEVLSGKRSLQGKCTRAGECLCSWENQEAAGAEGRGIALRAHVRPDPVGLQDVTGGCFYLSKLWSLRIIRTEQDLV